MHLSTLQIQQVRNLLSANLSLSPRFNIITGENGAGKTSVLEAIHILSTGHSFRSRDIKKIIQHLKADVLVAGNVLNPTLHEKSIRIAIQKDTLSNTTISVDGEREQKLSALTKQFPCLSIDTNSLEVIEGGPSLRRRIIDWGMFHVEHDYLLLFQNYKKVLTQKAELLRQVKQVGIKQQIGYWNKLQAQYGMEIDTKRMEYFRIIQQPLSEIYAELFEDTAELKLDYVSGWNKTKHDDLFTYLQSVSDQEILKRQCLYGPHRADFKILYDGHEAKEICSRGQKKLVLYGVRLAQIRHMNDVKGYSPAVLLDDLPAELDYDNQKKVLKFLMNMNCQCFITAIHIPLEIKSFLDQQAETTMFHVEHGTIS